MLKAFKIYWHESIAPEGERFLGEATVIAVSIDEALIIGNSYGPVKSVFSELGAVITDLKTTLREGELSQVRA